MKNKIDSLFSCSLMGIKEYRATGGNAVLLKEYHRKSDSLAQWQINFSKYDKQTYAFDHIGIGNHGTFTTNEYCLKIIALRFPFQKRRIWQKRKILEHN